ncbi:helix-turn-helix transcriptional regulator [Actinomycetospora lemnae]|uniref:WYL domain-containing protein n=1 Tax=Actinomycetospora lemnae TaxID=3019891 RepID=A0ABT5SNY5_9PSEU|nr:WYL domain-containing protein [Actinomycetospora sp. DW7H6]MDD7964537.1 WYL domain-containing protein [Actinomycetospora sp. DW7H6]
MSTSPSARAERLVNLVLCLLSTRQYLSAERIRATVPGYADVASDEAFFRMFERDKAELRELGVPLETGRSSLAEPVDGYRIARGDYELPDIDLAPDEATAVALAARLWDSPALAGAARTALQKLRAAGIAVDPDAASAVQPRLQAAEPAFAPLLAASRAGRVVTFTHRSHPAAEARTRTVEPWGVVSWRGRWYLVGHDRDRDDVRCFRLSRIGDDARAIGPRGAVSRPADVDLVAIVAASAGPPPPTGRARIRLVPGRAEGLRRGSRPDPQGDPDVVEIDLGRIDMAARWVAGHGPDAVVLEPPELREAVVGLLRGSLVSAPDTVDVGSAR